MRKGRLLAGSLVALAALWSSCGGSTPGTSAAPSTTVADPGAILGEWLLVQALVSGDPYVFPGDSPYLSPDRMPGWVRFDADGRVAGGAPCNDFGGEYEFDGSTLSFHDWYQSAVLCAPDIMEAEDVVTEPFRRDSIAVTFRGDSQQTMTWTWRGGELAWERITG